MIADMLLEAKRPQQALAEYQTDLKLNPNRFDGLYGAARAAEAAGKQNDATEYYALLLKVCDGSNSTRPELTSRADSWWRRSSHQCPIILSEGCASRTRSTTAVEGSLASVHSQRPRKEFPPPRQVVDI